MHAEKNIPVLKKTMKVSPWDRFMSKVNKSGPIPPHKPELGPCWIYTGKKSKDGYGKFSIGRCEITAHRYSYSQTVGEIPEGLKLDHLCKNRPCVNPSHVEPVTQRVNVLRSNSLQAKNAAKTHCVNGHEFTSENTRISGGWRVCRECTLIRKADKRAKLGMTARGRYSTKATKQRVLP